MLSPKNNGDNKLNFFVVVRKKGENLYVEYIMRNAGLDEAKAGIKIAERNINLRYADDTTLMAESEEKLKSLGQQGDPTSPS